MLKHIKDVIQGKTGLGKTRSHMWPSVRAAHLKIQPCCAVCGGTESLEVHHKLPFHLHPKFELDPLNLITLCESKRGGINCHLALGHLGDFRSYNKDVEKDADEWNFKIHNRP